MKTKASIMGHPVHMGVAHFPVAFLIGAFAFDVAAKVSANDQLVSVAAYLVVAGVATGVLAAVPGIVDFLTTVPMAVRPKAMRHLVTSVLGLLMFGGAWFVRANRSRR